MKIWIDDVRDPPRGWFWSKTSRHAIRLLNTIGDKIEEISFDHDLGGDDTSIPVANLLEQMAYEGKIQPIVWRIHSANPVGRQNLERALTSADKYWNNR